MRGDEGENARGKEKVKVDEGERAERKGERRRRRRANSDAEETPTPIDSGDPGVAPRSLAGLRDSASLVLLLSSLAPDSLANPPSPSAPTALRFSAASLPLPHLSRFLFRFRRSPFFVASANPLPFSASAVFSLPPFSLLPSPSHPRRLSSATVANFPFCRFSYFHSSATVTNLPSASATPLPFLPPTTFTLSLLL